MCGAVLAIRHSSPVDLDPSTVDAEPGPVAPQADAFDVHPVQFSHPPLDGPADRFTPPDGRDARSDAAPVFQAPSTVD